MKIAAFEQIKKSLQKAKGYTSNKISELADATVAAIEEMENKKANASHNHAASNITSGTLPIARGGTGNTTGNAATATKLKTARTIDGVPFDGSANIVHFGVCDTAADVAEKTVALTGFVLAEGARIIVYFLNGHTKSSPSLNVNNTGAKPISCVVGTYAPLNQWEAKQAVEFIYYSNHWIMLTANARRLYTARTIRTNLASTSSASFDGTANITPGVTGTLPIANGGTGATTASNARTNLGAFSSSGGTISGNVIINGTVAEGTGTTASGPASHAEGGNTTASGAYSHAEGNELAATGDYSHAEGYFTLASGDCSHSEGKFSVATAGGCHVEGYATLAGLTGSTYKIISINSSAKIIYIDPNYFGKSISSCKVGMTIYMFEDNYSHLYSYTIDSIDTTNNSITVKETIHTTNVLYAIVTKKVNIAPSSAHAEGGGSVANGNNAHAEGGKTLAVATCSHAGGQGTIAASTYQTAIGKYNKVSTAETDKFIIGNGTSDTARSNCFRVTNTSGVYSNSTFKSSGADYAEMLEWLDGNVEKEDRTGLFVTLEKDKIRIATPEDDYILGIVSACPSVCGDVRDDTWGNMHLTDIYGQPILEEVEIPERTEEIVTVNEEGEEVTETVVIEQAHTEIRQKLNPEYDNTREYIPRSERPEWNAIGVLGKLVAIDDGSCEENGWCKVGQGGIATISEQKTRFRVMKRLDQNHIKILIL